MESNQTDNNLMTEGVSQMLGFKPYRNVPVTEECDHEDDGYEYGETKSKLTLRCSKCGVFYEEKK